MTIEEEGKEILALRALIPEMTCPITCHACCGPCPWSRWEWAQVKDKREASSITCPYAMAIGCAVYEHRPILCRLMGVSEKLPCSLRGKPERILTSSETALIMRRYMRCLEVEHGEARPQAQSRS